MTGHDIVVRKRILLVDDQPEVREVIKLLLELDEHTVTEAGDGREALDLYTRDHFDLVVTDYAMPMMRGDELAARVKQLAPAQPILMISGSGNTFGRAAELVELILRKPFTLPELRHALAMVLTQAPAALKEMEA